MSSHNPYATVTLNHPDGVPPAKSPNQTSGGSAPHPGTPGRATLGLPPPMQQHQHHQQQQQQQGSVQNASFGSNSFAQQYANAAGGVPPSPKGGSQSGAPPRSPLVAPPRAAGLVSPHGSFSRRPDLGETGSERSASSGGACSLNHDSLPLCPDDSNCQRVNDRDHQKLYSHTCRLFPCFHAHLKYHTRFFRHVQGQAATTSSEDGNSSAGGKTPSNSSTSSVSRTRAAKHRKQARKALSSVSFTHISPDAPNAQKIVVLHGNRAFEIAGDWGNVMLHTFKRYLYQVTGVRPAAQVLKLGTQVLTDEVSSLAELGVQEGTQLAIDVDVAKSSAPQPMPLSTDASGSSKIPVAWL